LAAFGSPVTGRLGSAPAARLGSNGMPTPARFGSAVILGAFASVAAFISLASPLTPEMFGSPKASVTAADAITNINQNHFHPPFCCFAAPCMIALLEARCRLFTSSTAARFGPVLELPSYKENLLSKLIFDQKYGFLALKYFY
jgi:hypothetical protein